MATTDIQAPTVRNLNDIVSTLQQGYAPEMQSFQGSLNAEDQYNQAQQQGIEGQKNAAFAAIPAQAQKQGVYFSGFSPEEQARYTSNTYLPALANLASTVAQARAGIVGQQAQLQGQIFNQAYNTQNQDTQNLDTYNNNEAQRQFSAAQAQIDRDFQAGQAAKAAQEQQQLEAQKEAFSAQQNSLDRSATVSAASAKAASSSGPSYANLAASAKGAFNAASPDKYLDQNEAGQVYAGILQMTGGDTNLARQLFNQGMAEAGKVKYGNYSI